MRSFSVRGRLVFSVRLRPGLVAVCDTSSVKHQGGFSERLALIERAHPFRFNLVLFGVIASVWLLWNPVQAAVIFVLGVTLRVWLFRPGGPGDRLLARYWGWDEARN